MMNIWTILIADNYWVKRRKSHTQTLSRMNFLKSKSLMQQQLLGVSSQQQKYIGEGGKSIDSRNKNKHTLTKKKNISVLCYLLFFLPLLFHVLLTVRSECVWNNIHSHTISYMIMKEQKINRDQGRKQTAERLNFRFFFIFLIIFLRLRVVSR